MYRSDKQFMRDPATANSRIYIGNIAEPVVAENLDQKFRAHGKILGLVLQRGFGFIQYESEYQAKQAIEAEHGCMFYGKKLNVKQAYAQSPNQGPPNKQFPYQQPNNQNANFQHPPQHQNTEKPREFERDMNRPGPPYEQHQPQNTGPQQQKQIQHQPQHKPLLSPKKNPPPPHSMQQQPQQQFPPPQQKGHLPSQRTMPPQQQQHHLQNDQPTPDSREPPMDEDDGAPPGGGGGDREGPGGASLRANSPSMGSGGPPVGGGPPGLFDNKRGKKRKRVGGRERERELDRYGLPLDYRNAPYYGRDDPYGPNYPHPMVDAPPERNDCEIIVVSKALTEYAEYIEQRLKSLGLIVDLLFPNEDVPIGRVLANISSRGCLYAILIMPQNEEHRSLTLDILHGIPQEHRNMPIEDAFTLLTRNFDAYMRGEQLGRNTNGTGVNNLSDRHPESIQMLLNLLAENRQITTVQYDRLIKYLLQRRDLQSQHEISESSDVGQEEPSSKQAELQNRILNILNKSSDEPKPAEPVPAAPAVAPTPLLNDPTVQKALDSLLLGDMFKSIGSTA